MPNLKYGSLNQYVSIFNRFIFSDVVRLTLRYFRQPCWIVILNGDT